MCRTKNMLRIISTGHFNFFQQQFEAITAAYFISHCFGQDQDKAQLKRESLKIRK